MNSNIEIFLYSSPEGVKEEMSIHAEIEPRG
jgi:hypothetical protein